MTEAQASAIRDDWAAALRRVGLTQDQLRRNKRGRIDWWWAKEWGIPTQASLARTHGVSSCAISDLLHGRTHTGRSVRGVGGGHSKLSPTARRAVLRAWLDQRGPAERLQPRGQNRGRSVITAVAREHGISRQAMWGIVRAYEAGKLAPLERAAAHVA